jgi:hypothetical protein
VPVVEEITTDSVEEVEDGDGELTMTPEPVVSEAVLRARALVTERRRQALRDRVHGMAAAAPKA